MNERASDAPAAPFTLALRTRVVFGCGALARLGELARELGATRAFLVTDPGIVRAGYATRARTALHDHGVAVQTYTAVRENPTSADVAACREALGDWPADLLVGLGGGSSIDVAKGCAFVRAGGGRMPDYQGVGRAKGTLLPLIAIPTTAGTGSEVQSFALIARDDTHAKMACGDAQAAPKVAILDPELTVTQPRFVTASTGCDALVHAVESAVTTARTPASVLFALAAFERLCPALPRVLVAPEDLLARSDMLLGATYAGIAIEHSMLGAAHALANPLTAHYGVAHGHAVILTLPAVVRYNACVPHAATIYAELARRGQLCSSHEEEPRAVAALVACLKRLLAEVGLPPTLEQCGVPRAALPDLAAEAAQQWTAQFNPRPVDSAALQRLLLESWACS